jgi:hypothetical protein
MEKSKMLYDAVIAGIVIAIHVTLYFIFPNLPLPPGRAGQAIACLVLVDVLLLLFCLFKKLWLSAIAFAAVAVFYASVLTLG